MCRFFIMFCVLQAHQLAKALEDESVDYGMQKVVQAFDMACDFADTDCSEKQEGTMKQVLNADDAKNNPSWKMNTFAYWSFGPLRRLPKVYEEKCGKFLDSPLKETEADEKELEDDRKDYPLRAYAHCLVQTLREVSNGTMKRDWDLFYYGMKKAVQAYQLACEYEATTICDGSQEWKRTSVLEGKQFENKPKKQLEYFGYWSKGDVLKKLSNLLYEEKCNNYLSEPGAKPPADESEVLDDNGKEYPYKAYAHCLVHVLRERSNGSITRDWKLIDVGMEKTLHALEVVCEFEETRNNKCKGDVRGGSNRFRNWDTYHNDSKILWHKFEEYIRLTGLAQLPDVYKNCSAYSKDPMANLMTYEEDALEDSGMDYPYRAFAHCLMQTMRSENGGTMPAVVEEAKKREDGDAPEID